MIRIRDKSYTYFVIPETVESFSVYKYGSSYKVIMVCCNNQYTVGFFGSENDAETFVKKLDTRMKIDGLVDVDKLAEEVLSKHGQGC